MRVMIGEFEVEIKAKRMSDVRFNKKDTMYLLNDIAIAFCESSENNRNGGYIPLAENDEKIWKQIHNQLDELGAYKNL